MKVSARVTVILNAQQRMVPLETHSHACWQASEIHFQVHSREPVAEDASPSAGEPLHGSLLSPEQGLQEREKERRRRRKGGKERERQREKVGVERKEERGRIVLRLKPYLFFVN